MSSAGPAYEIRFRDDEVAHAYGNPLGVYL